MSQSERTICPWCKGPITIKPEARQSVHWEPVCQHYKNALLSLRLKKFPDDVTGQAVQHLPVNGKLHTIAYL